MASSRRKQDEKHLKILRELGSQVSNRTCFDCHQRGTTYINMTVGSFVCTSCSGILRGLNPPHRVKSISMATFTPEEIEQIKSKGNQYCQAVWLGLYDAKANPFPDTKDEHKIRDFMITKYEKKRFYIDPSVALKNMATQSSSAGSSAASTPSSETSKSVVAANSSVSRPTVPASQSSGSVAGVLSNANNSTSKTSTPKSSTSLDLLADLSSGGGSQSAPAVNSSDPFASPTSSQPANSTITQASFANFENANIFTNTSGSAPSNKSTPSGAPTPFLNSPLTPMIPGSSSSNPPSSSSTSSSSHNPAANNPTQDRYAALKDLDEEFKTQKESETASSNGSNGWSIPNGTHHQNSSGNGVVFGSSSSAVNGGSGAFGSPGASSNVFTSTLVNGGGVPTGVFGTPPSNSTPWVNLPGANPFSGGSNTGSGATWMNGGNSFVSPPQNQQGFSSVVQPNPFGTTPDPNFNQFNSGAGLNGTSSASGNTAWANFSQPSQNTKLQWMAGNGPANPFMATPQMPSNGTSYNPFL